MPKEIIRQLKMLRQRAGAPREDWVKNNRSLLVSQIRNTIAPSAPRHPIANFWSGLSVLLPEQLVYQVIRPIAVLLIVALVGTSGWIATVDASYQALPGDWLYPAKRAAEKTQVVVASIVGDNNKEVKLHIKFANLRAEEAMKVMRGQGSASKTDRAREAITDLKSEIASLSTKLDESKTQITVLPAEVAKDVKQNTEQIKTTLQTVKDGLLTSTSANDKLLSKEISETKNLVKDVSVKAVEVLVTKHLGGDLSVSKEDVRDAIQSSLLTSASDVVESKHNVDGVKNIVATMQSEVKDLAHAQPAASSTAATQELSQQITTVANQTVRAIIKTEVATAEVGKRISEAQELLGNNQLIQAIDKVKEASNATKEAEKISDATVAQAQEALSPVAQVIKETSAAVTASSSAREALPSLLNNSVVSSTMVNSTTSVAARITPTSSAAEIKK